MLSLAPQQKIIALVTHSYGTLLFPRSLLAYQLNFFHNIAKAIPIYELYYKREFELLPVVVERISEVTKGLKIKLLSEIQPLEEVTTFPLLCNSLLKFLGKSSDKGA